MKKTFEVKVTDNYEKFNILEGNREIKHYQKIYDSIRKNGFFMNPILVNEKYEIIDGQGRFEALKKLRLPIYYIVQNGLGLKECRVLNIQQTNWKVGDFIESYANEGEPNYVLLQKLIEEFPFMTASTISALASGSYSRNSGGSSPKSIRNGSYFLTKEDYDYARKKFQWIEKFTDSLFYMKGRSHYLYSALAFCYDCDQIDNDMMLLQFRNYANSYIRGLVSFEDALIKLETIYNCNRGRRKATPILSLYRLIQKGDAE